MKQQVNSRVGILLAFILIAGISFNLNAQSISISFTVSDYNGNNISCHGASDGSILATPSGGTSPYTYLWSTTDTVNDLDSLPAGVYIVTVTDSNNITATDSVELTQSSTIGATFSNGVHNGGYNISVSGGSDGSITTYVTGGTITMSPGGGYAYNWSNGSSGNILLGLTAGIYTLTATDQNGCTGSASDTLTEPPPLHVDSIGSPQVNGGYNIGCNGGINGSIHIWVSGGVMPYHGNRTGGGWGLEVDSNALDLQPNQGTGSTGYSISAGDYSFQIYDANGAEVDTSITLTQPSEATSAELTQYVFPNGYNVSCHYCSDGAMTIAGAGGVEPYTYQWYDPNDSLISTADSIGNLAGGNYSAIITDANGCTASDGYITVGEPTYVFLSITMTDSSTKCHGDSSGSINITVSGGMPPYASYLWSNGATTQNISNVPAGNYTVTVYDARNDSLSDSIYVSQPSAMGITFSNSSHNGYNISIAGGSDGTISSTLTGGTTPYQSYIWNDSTAGGMRTALPAGIYTLTVADDNGCIASVSDTLTQPPPLNIGSLYSPVLNGGFNTSCNGGSDGSIHLSMSGGVQPYYAFYRSSTPMGYWYVPADSDTLNLRAIPAGFYSIQIYDANGAELDTAITLTQPDAVSAELTQVHYGFYGNNVSCYYCTDGAMSLAGTGGVAPYTYQWFNANDSLIGSTDSISHLAGGSYSAIVTDANGCSKNTGTITVTQPSYVPLSITMTASGTNCYNDSTGSIAVAVTGGTPPYLSYIWSNGATTQNLSSIPAGSYKVTVYDTRNDSLSDSVTVTQPTAISIGFTNSNYSGYNISVRDGSDGTISPTVTGGTAAYASYLWNNASSTADLTGLPVGIYSVTVTDANGCTASASDTLIQPPPMQLDSIYSPQLNGGFNTSCNGGSDGSIHLSVSMGLSPYYANIYNAAIGGSWYVSSDGNSLNQSSIPYGHYTIQLFDATGAEIDSGITLTQPDSLHIAFTVSHYPNGFNVSSIGGADGSLAVTLTGGVSSYTYQWQNETIDSAMGTTNNIDSLPAALYSVSVSDANGCTASAERWIFQSSAWNGGWGMSGSVNTDPSFNYIGTTDSVDFVMRANNAEAMRVTATGNVGIGTASPIAKLDVNGDARITGQVKVQNFAGVTLPPPVTVDWNGNLVLAGTILGKCADLTDNWLTDYCNHPYDIYTNSLYAKVGIGVTNPQYPLDVKGTIHACEILVDLNNGCDFVFDSCYEQMPLNELAYYLKINKHLPEIAPAKEMEANGVNVGDMQAKLLQKIEELTLYTIELQKQVDELKSQIKK